MCVFTRHNSDCIQWKHISSTCTIHQTVNIQSDPRPIDLGALVTIARMELMITNKQWWVARSCCGKNCSSEVSICGPLSSIMVEIGMPISKNRIKNHPVFVCYCFFFLNWICHFPGFVFIVWSGSGMQSLMYYYPIFTDCSSLPFSVWYNSEIKRKMYHTVIMGRIVILRMSRFALCVSGNF